MAGYTSEPYQRQKLGVNAVNPLPPINKLLAHAHDFFNDSTPDGSASDLNPDIQSKVKVLLQSALQKMDVVSREEFDAQTAVLQRTRQRLEALEAELVELTQVVTDEQVKQEK